MIYIHPRRDFTNLYLTVCPKKEKLAAGSSLPGLVVGVGGAYEMPVGGPIRALRCLPFQQHVIKTDCSFGLEIKDKHCDCARGPL